MSAGSHATFGGWEPRHCCVCGKPVVLSGPKARGAVFRFKVETGARTSRHADCRPLVKVER